MKRSEFTGDAIEFLMDGVFALSYALMNPGVGLRTFAKNSFHLYPTASEPFVPTLSWSAN